MVPRTGPPATPWHGINRIRISRLEHAFGAGCACDLGKRDSGVYSRRGRAAGDQVPELCQMWQTLRHSTALLAAPMSDPVKQVPAAAAWPGMVAVMDCFPDPVVVLDPEYHIVAANQAYRRLYCDGEGGCRSGRRCFELTHRYRLPCGSNQEFPAGWICPSTQTT